MLSLVLYVIANCRKNFMTQFARFYIILTFKRMQIMAQYGNLCLIRRSAIFLNTIFIRFFW